MNKVYFLPLALAAAVTTAASADTYTNFLTGVSEVASDGAITAVGGEWTTNGVSLAKVDGKNAVDFDTSDATMRLDVTAAPADTNTIVRVDLEVSLSDAGELMTPTGAQTAFAVYTNAYNVWNGSAWVALNEIPAGLENAATTNLLVELKYQGSSTRYARFSVGGAVLRSRGMGTPDWIELGTKADNFTGMGINGSGTIAKADAEVMLGIAEFEGVKYGTLSEAVTKAEAAAALAGGTASPISVVRETSENVDVTSAGVVIADNGNVNGEIKVTGDVQVDVVPNKDEFTNSTSVAAGASGTYTIPVSFDGGTVHVSLPDNMANKEIAETVRKGKTVTVTIQTAASIITNAAPGGRALAANETKLREFLEDNLKEVYDAADVSSASIATALAATGENDIPLYQSYALGIDPDVSVKPVTKPGASTEGGITLHIPNLVGKAGSGDYRIKYKVGDTVQDGGAGSITIPTTPDSTGSYPVKIVFE